MTKVTNPPSPSKGSSKARFSARIKKIWDKIQKQSPPPITTSALSSPSDLPYLTDKMTASEFADACGIIVQETDIDSPEEKKEVDDLEKRFEEFNFYTQTSVQLTQKSMSSSLSNGNTYNSKRKSRHLRLDTDFFTPPASSVSSMTTTSSATRSSSTTSTLVNSTIQSACEPTSFRSASEPFIHIHSRQKSDSFTSLGQKRKTSEPLASKTLPLPHITDQPIGPRRRASTSKKGRFLVTTPISSQESRFIEIQEMKPPSQSAFLVSELDMQMRVSPEEIIYDVKG